MIGESCDEMYDRRRRQRCAEQLARGEALSTADATWLMWKLVDDGLVTSLMRGAVVTALSRQAPAARTVAPGSVCSTCWHVHVNGDACIGGGS